MSVLGLIITLAIITGQLVKLPLGSGGATLADLVVIIFCIYGLFQTRLRLKNPPLFIKTGLFFCLVAILSLVFTPLALTDGEYLISFFYTLRFFTYILLGWLLFSKALASLKMDIHKVLSFSGLSLSVLGLMQFIFLPDLGFLTSFGWDPHFYRATSTFLDPNFLGAYLVLTLLTVSQSHLGGRTILTPRVFYMIFIIIYLALLTTFSRSSYGMFLISFLALSFFKKSAKLAYTAIILFCLLILSFQIYIRAVNQVTPLDRGQTASYRFTTWQQGFEIFSKNPILGVGFNAYNFALRQYKLGDQQFLAGKGSTTNDSSLVHIASTTGILGLFAYFYFLLSLCKTWKKNPFLTAGVFGLVEHSIFVNSLFYPFILIWIVLFASSSYGHTE